MWRLSPAGAADASAECGRAVYQALQCGTGLRGGLAQPQEGARAHRVRNDVSCVAVRNGTIVTNPNPSPNPNPNPNPNSTPNLTLTLTLTLTRHDRE